VPLDSAQLFTLLSLHHPDNSRQSLRHQYEGRVIIELHLEYWSPFVNPSQQQETANLDGRCTVTALVERLWVREV
jgi:hypothetical protein